jgi:hypothetical protein
VLFYFHKDFFSRLTVRLRQGVAAEAFSRDLLLYQHAGLPTPHDMIEQIIQSPAGHVKYDASSAARQVQTQT